MGFLGSPRALFNGYEVRKALSSANSNLPQGSLDDASGHWQIASNGQLQGAADYAGVMIKYQNGAAVAMRDVAQLTDGVEDVRTAGLDNGKPAVLVVISPGCGR